MLRFHQLVLPILFSLSWGVSVPTPPIAKAEEGFSVSSINVKSESEISVDSIGITVSDMDKSLRFYTEVISFQKISDTEVWGNSYDRLQGIFGVRMRVVKLRLGDEFLELTEYLTPRGKPIPIDSRSNDRWFQHIAIAVSDMDKAYAILRQFKVQYASTAPQTIPSSNKVAAGIQAFYFKDPDGHNLELIFFPEGKGDRKWQNLGKSSSIFLGIDHTAIVIGDTNRSLRFYRDLLGLRLVGESQNFGIEQEYLNHVFGARLQISGLRSSSGMGIEFLNYLTPGDGRPFPADAQANDLLHWQTTLIVKDILAIAQKLRSEGTKMISTDVIGIPNQSLGFKRGFLIRDPDGHALRIIER
ncbi:lactoylglutathione lyase-like lyase [Synechococcus sp. PCC 7502]|uniref:VOC family protein n=1 Tax=Synechococcus sp. PCC 7502 TaxID=1173263 RepID=UPI00029FE502|nr:VOC family protein [Synechococcus sp. PCC 7502]AFY75092.1 lactoylglutathione lyase-like lyase [Synechococcus sp. PCC 7502]